MQWLRGRLQIFGAMDAMSSSAADLAGREGSRQASEGPSSHEGLRLARSGNALQ